MKCKRLILIFMLNLSTLLTAKAPYIDRSKWRLFCFGFWRKFRLSRLTALTLWRLWPDDFDAPWRWSVTPVKVAKASPKWKMEPRMPAQTSASPRKSSLQMAAFLGNWPRKSWKAGAWQSWLTWRTRSSRTDSPRNSLNNSRETRFQWHTFRYVSLSCH